MSKLDDVGNLPGKMTSNCDRRMKLEWKMKSLPKYENKHLKTQNLVNKIHKEEVNFIVILEIRYATSELCQN